MAGSLTLRRVISRAAGSTEDWGWLEVFILIEYLSSALLMVPGAQAVRIVIRSAPYLASLALGLKYYWEPTSGAFPGRKLLSMALLWLFIEFLFHPDSRTVQSGVQVIFQISIAAPAFWVGKVVKSKWRLDRILYLVFLANALGGVVGFLQVKYPNTFMPAEFSKLGQTMDRYYVESLTYEGANGQLIIRPPGLSDMPGGAATAGMTAGLLGVVLALGESPLNWSALLYLAAAGLGMVALYLTEVRSLLMVMILAMLISAAVAWRRNRTGGIRIAAVGGGVVAVAFIYAVTIGGQVIEKRYMSIKESGVVDSYNTNRGLFVKDTWESQLPQYPLGAGPGRWGMMQVYTADIDANQPPPLYAEIQLTGWLFDGGIPMWILYGGAVLAAMAYALRLTVKSRDPDIAYLAGLVLCLEGMIFGIAWAGPAFNTQLGIQFWTLSAALHGAASRGITPRAGRVQRFTGP